jgi:lipopolysaccharide exporter
MADGLTARTLSGAKWTYVAVVSTAALQIVFTAVLARLLGPSAFGLMAMAALALRFGQYFAQMGLGQALVQAKEIDRNDIGVGFTVSTLLGVGFYGLFWVIAPGVSAFFRSPDLTPVMRTMSLTFVLAGASVTSLSLLRRDLRFKAISITDMLSYVLGYGSVGVVLALRGFGVWSLVWASLGQSLMCLVGYYAASRHPLRFALRSPRMRPLLGFGSKVSVLGVLEFLASNLDTIAVGRFLGDVMLGFYSRALSIANLPVQYLSTSLSRVLLPSLARIQDDEEKLKRVYLAAIMLFGATAVPIAAGVVGGARPIVLALLGPRWISSVDILRIVAIAAPLTVLTHFGEVVCEARAALNVKLVVRAAQLVVFSALLLGLGRFGVLGFATAFTLSETLMHLAYVVVMRAQLGVRAGEYARAYTPAALFSVVVLTLVSGLAWVCARLGVPAVLTTFLLLLVGAAALGFLVLRTLQGCVWAEAKMWLDRARGGRPRDTRGGRVYDWVDMHLAVRGAPGG